MPAEVVGIVAVNSTEYVEATLACHSDDVVGVSLRDVDDQERISAAGVVRIITPGVSTGWRRSNFTPQLTDEVSQILFTSGTTGARKGIGLTGRNIADTTARLTRVMRMDDSIREYVGAPVFYSFGLFRCRAVSAVGGEYFLPANGFDPSEIASMLRRGEINALSGVPTQWRMLLDNAELVGSGGPGMKWIEIGSQSMSRAEKEALKRLFPNANIVQHYGLTEASRTTFLKVHEEQGRALESVGRAEDRVELAIDADGQIRIRGPHVATQRLGPDGWLPLVDEDGWLTTGDIGTIEEGLLYYHGRSDDLINCGGVKLFPEAIEHHMHEVLGTLNGIVVSRTFDRLRGEGILVSFVEAPGASEKRVRVAAVKAAERLGINAAGAIHLQRVEQIPRTETGKVQRQALIDQFEAAQQKARETSDAATTGEQESLEQLLERLWKAALGVETIGPNSSFFELGGDTASASKLIPQMEAAGVSPEGVHGILDGLTIAEIVALSTVAAPPPVVVDPRIAIEAQITEIWRGALGQTEVARDQSFYDIGGDSLSAVTVALQMERSGLDPALARGILAGKTIAILSDEMAARSAPVPADVAIPTATIRHEPVVRTPIAVLSESLNFVKGVVLLCMLASHWMPVYIDNLAGSYAGALRSAFAPLFSLGSPTLAFVFGLGIPIFFLRQYQSSTSAFHRTLRTTGLLLAAGLVIGGVADMVAVTMSGKSLEPGNVLLLLYGPFAYFLPATLSIPLWLKHLRTDDGGLRRVFFAALVFYAAYTVMWRILPATSESMLITAAYRLVVGHWSLLQMAAISLFGVGVGLIIDRRIRSKQGVNDMLGYGVLMVGGAVVMSLAAFDLRSWIQFPKPITLWSIVGYSGLALVMIAVFERVMDRARENRVARGLLEIVCSMGIVLFPLYVIQSVVYHGATILSQVAEISFLRALSVCIAVFSFIAAYLVGRVYRLYYGRFWGVRTA